METNFTTTLPIVECNLTINPWCGSFGAQQHFEVMFLVLLIVLGVFGNLLVIFSIVLDGKVNKHGNIFIINLAVADLLVTGVYTPTLVMNVIASGPALPTKVCQAFGVLIIFSCSASMATLCFIALNRYWAVVRSQTYKDVFKLKYVLLMIFFVWVWSAVVVIPTFTGWSKLQYDYKAMTCSYNDLESTYNIFLMSCVFIIPLALTIYCYLSLFLFVKKKNKKILKGRSSFTHHEDMKKRKRLERQMALVKTLVVTVLIFILCWAPYTICVFFLGTKANPLTKKICNWLGICNSSVNFIIYGVLNQGYRNGYKKLFSYIFCSKACPNSITFQSRSYSASH